MMTLGELYRMVRGKADDAEAWERYQMQKQAEEGDTAGYSLGERLGQRTNEADPRQFNTVYDVEEALRRRGGEAAKYR